MTEVSFLDPRDKLHFAFRATSFCKFIIFALGNLFKLVMDRVMFTLAKELPEDMRGVYAEVCKQTMSGNSLPAPSPAQDFLAKRRWGRRLEP
ncbi:MAG: hypothetical protein HYU84_03895 [Chloroflexi bacterium]|nr:hypothetical protein [Chloroflexota bacterium]MBI3169404.1 hypothetical protein [Chloroflexota bacterium]